MLIDLRVCFLTFLLTIFCSSCVEMRQSSYDPLSPQAEFQRSAAGTWSTSCSSLGGGWYQKGQFIYSSTDATYIADTSQYSDSTCTDTATLGKRLLATLQYKVFSSVANGDVNEYVMQETILSGSTTYYGATYVNFANTNSVCGDLPPVSVRGKLEKLCV